MYHTGTRVPPTVNNALQWIASVSALEHSLSATAAGAFLSGSYLPDADKKELREQTAADRVWPDGVSATVLQLRERVVGLAYAGIPAQYTGSRPT